MKKFGLILMVMVGFTITFTRCDKVEFPYADVPIVELDTTLYPGDWYNYLVNIYPTFSPNTNTQVNVLIEDYTGHTCINCPPAAEEAHSLSTNYPDRVFVASIHVDPGAYLGFQSTQQGTGKYYTDHTNPDGISYGKEFENGFNFWGNPSGTVNRKTVDGKMFDVHMTWEARVSQILNENNLKVNLQSVFNYYEETNGGFLHVEAQKLTDEELSINIVVYVIENELVDWQLIPGHIDDPNYVHYNKHLGSIDNRPWGVPLFGEENETKTRVDYSYRLPVEIDKSNLHFLIYVYDKDTYEILQVIRQNID